MGRIFDFSKKDTFDIKKDEYNEEINDYGYYCRHKCTLHLEDIEAEEMYEVLDILEVAEDFRPIPTYQEMRYNFPVCNYINGVENRNIGYSQGVTRTGIPFVAEVYRVDQDVALKIILPETCICEVILDDEKCESLEVISFEREEDKVDNSVLDIGMVDRGYYSNKDIMELYLCLLENADIIQFENEMRNCGLHYLTDVNGNDFVGVIITLVDKGVTTCRTSLDFNSFR